MESFVEFSITFVDFFRSISEVCLFAQPNVPTFLSVTGPDFGGLTARRSRA